MYRKGMPYTQEDIQRARNVNLVGYLESRGVELKRKGRMVCLKEHDSLVIDPANNKWHWNSRNVHGTNAVDFLMAYDNRTFLDAISELLGRPPNNVLPAAAEKALESKAFTLPPRSPNMHRLYACRECEKDSCGVPIVKAPMKHVGIETRGDGSHALTQVHNYGSVMMWW